MESRKSFCEKINQNGTLLGTLLTLDSPEIAEILSLCRFDWLFLDMEHGALSVPAIQHLIQAMQPNVSAIVRIPENSSLWIKKVLDTGCDGILVPQVKTAEEALSAVKAAKFPPQGERSVGISRAHGYGMTFANYVSSANKDIALIIQIEHIEGVNNIDEILAVEDIDGVFIGPYDLSGSMNLLGQVSDDRVQEKIKEIKQKCLSKKIPFGIFVMKKEAVKSELEDGCKFIAVGIDSTLLWNAAKEIVEAVKDNK